MIQPPFLRAGSTIGITCPSSYVAAEKVFTAIGVLEQWGFKVKKGNTIGTSHHYFSGTDDQRRADLQQMLDDPAIDAILMGRGGYGMSRIIDDLDFTQFVRHPKWICGFSDIVVLHSHIQARYGIATMHSPMCGAFTPENMQTDHLRSFYASITGESVFYHAPASEFNRYGTAEGILTGGNLAILEHLTGSVSEADTNGRILLIEDIGEHYYKVDRMMINLKRAGKLSKLKALIVGGFTDMEDTERPFGQSVEEIIIDKVTEYDYPVCFRFPVGHQDVNFTVTLGAHYQLRVTPSGATLDLKRNHLP